MAHKRLQLFETPGGDTMCVGVRAGGHIVLSGRVGSARGDAAAQAEEAMADLKRALEAAGAGVQHIRKVTTYIVDRAWWERVEHVITSHLGGAAAARVGVIVAGLATPDMLVAIDVDAVAGA